MLRDKIKISGTFERIKDNFFFTSKTNIIYQNRVTRAGIAAKTIILLLVVSLFSGVSWFFTDSFREGIKSIILPLFFIFSLITFFASIIGTKSVELSKVCSFVYSAFTGISVGIMLNLCKDTNVMPICLMALFATASVFVVTSYLYYKGSLLEIDNSQLIKKMSSIFFVLFIIELVALFCCKDAFYYAMISIPINLFMIIFSTLILIEHFRYVDNVIMNSMPIKYEWQLSLGFSMLFIAIFLRIFELLMLLFGRNND
ncbi:hypothetical protein CWO85_02805 [Candidatus Phytoplasma ziziphi]|uniref:Bax inhibitor-1/YccA family protein n=1 Tax=Ziziphus jujuba witches'-broom phytoplasma TaxID=135727 RepID=A0A660HNQ3_ZIZJU|nr:Bax inhibitor-1/YccA family protein [Candidatus Phytoplasma ziziphi]AYJ01416.1 hypothetical protein CWO85_02805 [Candidatus Phytoplasma ziziphi]